MQQRFFKLSNSWGIKPYFFRKNWEVVGAQFCRFVQDVFQCPQKVEEVNQPFLTLIPKKDEVSMVKDFRPIELCNFIYKAIIGLISQRLHFVTNVLIGPYQSKWGQYCSCPGGVPLDEEQRGEKRMDGYQAGLGKGL